MKSYQLISTTNIEDFNKRVNSIVKEQSHNNPRLVFFNSCISPHSAVYYSGVVEWGKDDTRPAVGRQM